MESHGKPFGSKQEQNFFKKRILMIYVGIDVAKDKHEYFIINLDGEMLFESFNTSKIAKVLKFYI